jgi:hypothetical protein
MVFSHGGLWIMKKGRSSTFSLSKQIRGTKRIHSIPFDAFKYILFFNHGVWIMYPRVPHRNRTGATGVLCHPRRGFPEDINLGENRATLLGLWKVQNDIERAEIMPMTNQGIRVAQFQVQKMHINTTS